MKWWWQLKKSESDLQREVRSDLELEEEEQREQGVPAEEASYAARRAFAVGSAFPQSAAPRLRRTSAYGLM